MSEPLVMLFAALIERHLVSDPAALPLISCLLLFEFQLNWNLETVSLRSKSIESEQPLQYGSQLYQNNNNNNIRTATIFIWQ